MKNPLPRLRGRTGGGSFPPLSPPASGRGKKWLHFARAQEGVAYLEFAIALPFLLVLFMGAVEVTRYIIVAQKVEKAAVTISDVVSQSEHITTGELNVLISAVSEVMQPYAFDTDGYAIITSVTKNVGSAYPTVNWQYKGGGSWVKPSLVGSPGLVATLPNGLTLNDKDTVIISEVYYNFKPMLANGIIHNMQLYKVAVFKPRIGDLKTLG